MTEVQPNDDAILKVCLSMYLGEQCQGCGRVYESLHDLYECEVVWWPWDRGRIGCLTCYQNR